MTECKHEETLNVIGYNGGDAMAELIFRGEVVDQTKLTRWCSCCGAIKVWRYSEPEWILPEIKRSKK